MLVMNCFLCNMSSHFDHPLSACIGMYLLSLSLSFSRFVIVFVPVRIVQQIVIWCNQQ